jgi:hypothetical protein
MSERFEAVIMKAASVTAHESFGALSSPLHLRLIRLSEDLYGIHRVTTRRDFPEALIDEVAAQVSKSCSAALAIFYDNQVGMRYCHLFRAGVLNASFGEQDEVWVRLDDEGEPIMDGERFSVDQLRDDEEYDCIRTGIDAGLEALVVDNPPAEAESLLIGAFCYDRLEIEAEHSGQDG